MSAEQRAPGFDLARQLPRDPQLRAYLAGFGYVSGTTICVLGPDDPWEKAADLTSDADGPVLTARQDPAAPHGWELRWTGFDPQFVATLREVMRDNAEAFRRLSRHDGGHGLYDARPLKLIVRSWAIPPKLRAQSIFWHHHDAQECLCRWPHGNCNDFPCPCPRHHRGEIQ